MNAVANMKMVKSIKCKVSISGGVNVKLKFPSQSLGSIVVSFNDKILRIYEVSLGRGEEIKISRTK